MYHYTPNTTYLDWTVIDCRFTHVWDSENNNIWITFPLNKVLFCWLNTPISFLFYSRMHKTFIRECIRPIYLVLYLFWKRFYTWKIWQTIVWRKIRVCFIKHGIFNCIYLLFVCIWIKYVPAAIFSPSWIVCSSISSEHCSEMDFLISCSISLSSTNKTSVFQECRFFIFWIHSRKK